MSDPQGLHARFENQVSIDAQRAIVKAMFAAYRAANDECKNEYDDRMQHQAWGYLRWLKVDSMLLSVGDRFGKIGRFTPNTENTHIGHTELHFGDIVLTAASVQAKGRRPRSAAYRDLLAESNQLRLFERHKKTGKVWGMILHVPNVAAREPLHIDVGFVDKDYNFAAQLIDLKKRFQVAADTVEAVPALKMRRVERTGE